jgi:hypothetical protein
MRAASTDPRPVALESGPFHVGNNSDLDSAAADLCVRWSGNAGRDGKNQVQRSWKPRNGHGNSFPRF